MSLPPSLPLGPVVLRTRILPSGLQLKVAMSRSKEALGGVEELLISQRFTEPHLAEMRSGR
jgi:hypothetical protein